MRLQLIPFELIANEEKSNLKHVYKMALVPQQSPAVGSTMPMMNSATSYNNGLNNSPITVQPSMDARVLSNLSREIVDILNDSSLNDDQRVSNYIHAIKRYLTFRDKVYNLTPVVSESQPLLTDSKKKIKRS